MTKDNLTWDIAARVDGKKYLNCLGIERLVTNKYWTETPKRKCMGPVKAPEAGSCTPASLCDARLMTYEERVGLAY